MKHSPAPWEQIGDEIYAANGTRIAEAVTMVDMPLLTNAPRLLAALSKLVELEDMRLRLRQLHEMGRGTDYTDYHRMLPLAWAAARDALGPNAEVTGLGRNRSNDERRTFAGQGPVDCRVRRRPDL